MDGRWVSGYSGYGVVSPYHLFRSWSDDAHALFAKYPEGLRVVGSADAKFLSGWKPKSLKKRFLEGRNAISIFNVTDFGGMSVVLCREISVEPKGCVIHARFEDAELYRARKRLDPSAVGEIASAAALIIAVDAERVLRRLSRKRTLRSRFPSASRATTASKPSRRSKWRSSNGSPIARYGSSRRVGPGVRFPLCRPDLRRQPWSRSDEG